MIERATSQARLCFPLMDSSIIRKQASIAKRKRDTPIMANNEEESKPVLKNRAVLHNKARKPKDAPTSEDGSILRERFLVSLNKETVDIMERLVRERGLTSPSTIIEFMVVNFGPWVLSADFLTVLADTVRNNRISGDSKQEE
jgi:hypothetical protein